MATGDLHRDSDWAGLGQQLLEEFGEPAVWTQDMWLHFCGKAIEAVNDLHHVYVDATLHAHRTRLLHAAGILCLFGSGSLGVGDAAQ